MAKPCEQCGADNPEIAWFCHQCGRPFSEPLIRPATRLTPLMQQWRKLSHKLTRNEVRKILGEPGQIDASQPTGPAAIETWTYEYEAADDPDRRVLGSILISIAESRVLSWTEPDWEQIFQVRMKRQV